MKQYIIFFLMLFCLAFAQAQVELQPPKLFGGQLWVGVTSSFGHGDFIKYHKSFHEVESSDSIKYSGGIFPNTWFSLGGLISFNPFKNKTTSISRWSFITGYYYHKRGFSNTLKIDYERSGATINDKSTFKEKYSLNYWTLPLLLHCDMGKSRRWGLDMGFTLGRYGGGNRHHVLRRTVSGKDAYEGGFRESDNNKEKLDKSIIKKGSTGLALGLSYRLNNKSLIRLYAENTSKVFATGRNFSSLTTHIQYAFIF